MRFSGLIGVVVGLLVALSIGAAAATAGTDAGLVMLIAVVFAAALRARHRFAAVDPADARVVLPLVLLPTVIGLAVFSERRIALLASMLVLLALVQGRRRAGEIKRRVMLLAMVVAILLPASRFSTTVNAQWWHAAAFLVLLTCIFRFPFPAVVLSLLDGIGVYLIANVVAHLAGIHSPAEADRTFALDSSTGGLRVFFPLSGSLAVPPLMGAMFVAAGLVCLQGGLGRRLLRTVAFAAGVLIMLEANTRAALVVSAVVLLVSVLAPRFFTRAAVPAGMVPMLFPFVYSALATAVIRPTIEFFASVLPFLSRGSVTSDVALEGRSAIWTSAIEFWQGQVDFIHRLVGYGEFGQRVSGASAVFAGGNQLLVGFSTHNSTLQQLYDGGLIGVAALAGAGLTAVWIFAAGALRASGVHLIALSALIAGLLGGGTEVTQAPGYATETFWVVAGLILVATTRGSSQLQPDQPEPAAGESGSALSRSSRH